MFRHSKAGNISTLMRFESSNYREQCFKSEYKPSDFEQNKSSILKDSMRVSFQSNTLGSETKDS